MSTLQSAANSTGKWPGKSWFLVLLRLVPGQLMPVPLRADLLSQAGGLSVRLPIGVAVSRPLHLLYPDGPPLPSVTF